MVELKGFPLTPKSVVHNVRPEGHIRPATSLKVARHVQQLFRTGTDINPPTWFLSHQSCHIAFKMKPKLFQQQDLGIWITSILSMQSQLQQTRA